MIPARLATLVVLGMLAARAHAEPASGVGKRLYESVCIACHGRQNIMVGAPKAGDEAAWRLRAGRTPRGVDALVDNAITGFGAMPPKAGHDALSRAEIRAAIDFMMAPQPSPRLSGVR